MSNKNTKPTETPSGRSLSIDWQSLLPGKDVVLLGATIRMYPLVLEKIPLVISQIESIAGKLSKEGITFKNFQKDKLSPFLKTIIMECPQLLSVLTDICLEDIRRLPLNDLLTLFTVAVEVNIESKESFEKNFSSLVSLVEKIFPEKAESPQTPPKPNS